MKQKSLLLVALFSVLTPSAFAQTSVYYGLDFDLTVMTAIGGLQASPSPSFYYQPSNTVTVDFTPSWVPGVDLDVSWYHFHHTGASIDEVDQLGMFVANGGGVSTTRLVPRFVLQDPPQPIQPLYVGRLNYTSYMDSWYAAGGGADGVNPEYQSLSGTSKVGFASSGPNIHEVGFAEASGVIDWRSVVDSDRKSLPGYRRLIYRPDAVLGFVARPYLYSAVVSVHENYLQNIWLTNPNGTLGLGPRMQAAYSVYHGLKFNSHQLGGFVDPPTWIIVTDTTIGPSLPGLNVIIRDAVTHNPVFTTQVDLDGTASGWLDYPPTPGSYEAYFRVQGGLGKAIPISALGSSNTPIQLRLGDADDDNEIGPSDAAAIGDHLGAFDTDPDWFIPNAAGVAPFRCDFNEDGEVGPSDVAILTTNFGEFGD